MRCRGRVDGGDRLLNSVFYALQHCLRTQIIIGINSLARFLHVSIRRFDVGGRLAQQPRRDPGSLSGGYPGVCLRQQAGDLRHVALGFGAGAGLAVRRLAGGVLGVFAALERVVERQAVVALRDGVVGAFERGRSGGVFGGGVPFAPGRAGRIDCPLCLIDFFVGRIRASGHKTRGGDQRPPPAATHKDQV